MAYADIWVVRKSLRSSSKVSYPVDDMTRQKRCTQSADIEPLIRSVANRAIVEVEAIYIDISRHCLEVS